MADLTGLANSLPRWQNRRGMCGLGLTLLKPAVCGSGWASAADRMMRRLSSHVQLGNQVILSHHSEEAVLTMPYLENQDSELRDSIS